MKSIGKKPYGKTRIKTKNKPVFLFDDDEEGQRQ